MSQRIHTVSLCECVLCVVVLLRCAICVPCISFSGGGSGVATHPQPVVVVT